MGHPNALHSSQTFATYSTEHSICPDELDEELDVSPLDEDELDDVMPPSGMGMGSPGSHASAAERIAAMTNNEKTTRIRPPPLAWYFAILSYPFTRTS